MGRQAVAVPVLQRVELAAALPDAESRLRAWMEGLAGVPWGWGQPSGDCCRFVDAGIKVQTGTAPLAAFTTLWGSEEEAEALLEMLGGLRSAVEALLGPPVPDPLFRSSGDLAFVTGVRNGRDEHAGPPRLGFILDEYVAVRAMPGVGLLRSSRVAAVWRLPR